MTDVNAYLDVADWVDDHCTHAGGGHVCNMCNNAAEAVRRIPTSNFLKRMSENVSTGDWPYRGSSS